MKKNIIKQIILILFYVPLLSSCFDYKEPNDIAYVVAIGIDEGSSDGVFNFCLQYARPTQITGGASEEGGKTDNTTGIISIESPSVYSALNLGNHVLSKTLTLSHTKIIIVSESIARKGISPVIDTLGRSADIRPNVYFCVSKGDAKDYIEAVKPTIEINPAKYYRLIFENNNSSYIPVNDAQKVYFNYKNGFKQNVIPYVGVAKDEKKKDGGEEENSDSGNQSSESSNSGQSQNSQNSNQTGKNSNSSDSESSQKETKDVPINDSKFEYHIKDYIAGNMDVEKENKSEAVGAAIFKGDKMISSFSGVDSETFNLLNGTYKNGYSVIYSKNSPNHPVTIRLFQKSKPRVKIKIKDDTPHINITLFLEGDLVSVPSDNLIEKNINYFEKDTKKYINSVLLEFLEKTKSQYDSDILGFGSIARKSFLTYDDFIDYNWNEKYKNTVFSLDIEFEIKKMGLRIKEENGNEG